MGYTKCHVHSLGIRYDIIYPHESVTGPIKSVLGGVYGYYNAAIGMVSSGILEYGSPGEVHNNYTSGSYIEVNPERHNFGSTTKLS